MRREDNLKAKRREKIEQIIRALSDKADNSPVVAELLRELLLSNEDDPDYGGSIYEIYRKDMVARDVASRESLERLAQLKTRLGVPAAETPKAVPAPKRSLRRVAGLRIASVAAALLVVASAAFWLTDADNRTTGRTAATTIAAATQTAPQACIKVETVEGVQKDITLQDNTKVWVNAETKISYPETFEDSREVYLAQGEAYFAVERDEEKPFTVHTENLQIKGSGN